MQNWLMRSEILETRLDELGWNRYQLAKEFCKLRAEDGEIPPVTRYQSTVNKAIADPSRSKFETIENLIEAMGGEIVIRWKQTEQVVTGHTEVKVTEGQ